MQPQNTIRNAHAILPPTLTPKSSRRNSHRSRTPAKETKNNSGNIPATKGSVTTLQFQDDYTLISASDIGGIIKVRKTDTCVVGGVQFISNKPESIATNRK